MSSKPTWSALSARIRGLIDASQLASHLFDKNNDSLGVMVDLGNHASAILSDVKAFGGSLDPANEYAIKAINRVAEKIGPMLVDKSSTSEVRQIYIRSAIVILAALEGEVSYLLRDAQDAIRSRSERAFEHLKRSILVDDNIKAAWKKAYKKREDACEKLGAVHLLSHGIWAFKVHANGARTDLVYQDQITDLASVERMSDGLVLTEWKRLVAKSDPFTIAEDARKQASLYSAGALAGAELTRYRYIVLVSDHDVTVPDDVEVSGVIYRHVNIPVNPKTPSKI